jgi:hypothetical protein
LTEWDGILDNRLTAYSLNPDSGYGFQFHTQTTGIETSGLTSSLTMTGAGDGGIAFYSPVYTDTTNTVDAAESVHSDIITLQAGTLNHGYHFYVSNAQTRGVGTINTQYGFYSSELTAATNNYYSWFDSLGVRRVKEDSAFNGTGQAIEALYNNQFIKYTPGATDYERLILGEWNSTNVAEIGTENGGSGVARPLSLITGGTARMTLDASGNVGVATSTPVANFQATTASTNATTTMEVGKSGQNKGSCLKLYRTDGSAIYAYVAAGATTFTLTTTACASVANF